MLQSADNSADTYKPENSDDLVADLVGAARSMGLVSDHSLTISLLAAATLIAREQFTAEQWGTIILHVSKMGRKRLPGRQSMPETDSEQLALEVLAKIEDLEKNTKRANAITSKAFTDMMKQSRTATRSMEADMTRNTSRVNEAAAMMGDKTGAASRAMSTRMLAGATTAGLVLLAVKKVLDTTIDALEEFGDIADKSAQSGLDAESFQELAYGASLAGVKYTLDQAMDRISTGFTHSPRQCR